MGQPRWLYVFSIASWDEPCANGAILLATPTTYLFEQDSHVFAGGDPAAFAAEYVSPPTKVIKFKFLPRP
jgi:hypothetical protein